MLVLGRKPGERVLIGNGIVVTVIGVRGGQVRLGIEASPQINIRRQELEWADAPAPTTGSFLVLGNSEPESTEGE